MPFIRVVNPDEIQRIMNISNRTLFLNHVAQTSPAPIGLEIVRAEGVHMWDTEGKQYTDFISGFSVMNLGHGQPKVKQAIQQQVDQYMHLMVYGELIESPQVQYAQRLSEYLPSSLDCIYFTNSGTEATEGAMKLAKRLTNRTRICAFNNAYHGSTQGALSIMGGEYWRNAYRPLLPDVVHLDYNNPNATESITNETACVVMEVVQAEAGLHAALNGWMAAIRNKCTETGTLLIFDEIQTGFGRTGTLWAFESLGVVPDILLLGKALGGGLPLGAFISSHQNMQALTNGPVLGHISTFAGHPVCCAAGLASFDLLLETFGLTNAPKPDWEGKSPAPMMEVPVLTSVFEKEQLLRTLLHHPAIHSVRSRGLLMAVRLPDADFCIQVCQLAVKAGVVTDWFLFAPDCLRIAPPLIISETDLKHAVYILIEAIDDVWQGRKERG